MCTFQCDTAKYREAALDLKRLHTNRDRARLGLKNLGGNYKNGPKEVTAAKCAIHLPQAPLLMPEPERDYWRDRGQL